MPAETDPSGTDPISSERTGLGANALRRHRWALGAGVAVFIAMGVFWALIFTGAFKQTNPDRLDDRRWVERTDRRCRPVRRAIDRLPNAGDATSAAQRAATVDRASKLVDGMLEAISHDPPAGASDRRIVRLWLADYRTYLADRRSYTRRLRHDPNAQPLFTERHGQSVQDAVTNFADLNDMGYCEAPPDL